MFKNPLRLSGVSIGARLTMCFVAIVLSMMAADVVAVWQFSRTAAPARRLNEADRTSLAVVRVHLDVDTFRDSVAALAGTHDIREFRDGATSLRRKFVEDVAQSQQLLASLRDAGQDPAIRSALETLRMTLPSQLDTTVELASAGDWPAVRLRVADQVQALIDLSSSLVEKVDREVSQERAEAIESAQRAHRQFLLVLPVVALLPLLVAVALGSYATRSITEPLFELDAGTRALARGDFHHQVAIQGEDELAHLGRVFNDTAGRLAALYGTLRDQADLLNLTHDTIFVADMEGVIRYWNRGAQEQYGWTAEQAVGRDVHDLLKTIFPAPLEQINAEMIRTGRWEGELVHTKKDGTQLVVASRWALQRGEQGAPVAILETNNDITERTQAEEALRRLNRELRALSDCNQTLLRATDEQSLLQEICRIVCEEAGYRPVWVSYVEHDQAKSVRPVAWAGTDETYLDNARISWSSDTERGRGPTGTAIRTGNTCCVQDFATDPRVAPWREILLEGGFRSGIALPLKDEHGNVFGSLTMHSAQPDAFTPDEIRLLGELAADLAFGIVTLRSRAARKQAEQEVVRLSFALDRVREAAFLVDDRGNFHYVNEEACRILGYSRAELLGLSVPEINPEFPAERWSDHWRELKAKRSLSFESRHRTRDGRSFPVEISANYFEYGGRAYNLALVRDITERKEAEDRLRHAVEALRQSEAYRMEAERLSHTGSWALDLASGRYDHSSEESLRIYGLDPRDGLPTTEAIFQRIHPEDRNRWKASFERSCREKVDTFDEYRIVLPDRTVKHIHSIRHPVLNDAGDVVRLVGTSIDMTERKQAEEALRESERKYHELVEHANSIILHWQRDGRIIHLNEFGQRFFGYTESEIRGRHVIGTIVPETESSGRDLQRLMDEICANPSAFEQNLNENMRRNGERAWIAWTNKVQLNSKGQVTEILSVGMDITDRKRAEEALRRSEAYLSETQRLSHTGSWASECTGRPLYWSEEVFRIFGFDPQQGIPTPDQPLQRIHPEDLDTFLGTFDRAVQAKVDFEVEARVVLPEGTARYIHGIGHPVLNANGEIVEVVGTVVDVTERKRAEEERERLRQLEADLAHLSRVSMLGELAASIAHEVNQPLSGIVSNGSACLRFLAGDTPNLEEVREAVRDIVRDGKRAGDVIARIRALTKRAATPREKLDLNETVREVLALVGDEAKKKGVITRTEFADDLSPVSGDRVQLQQVLLNLVMNAMEAMSSVGERARQLAVTTQNLDPDQVQVTVEDSGVGLEPNTIAKIFDPFYTTKPGGMGMGLSISRSILQKHDGRLWATVNDGPGTSFHFTLPKYHAGAADAGVAGV
jgi:PAS domain S-box-containing protein